MNKSIFLVGFEEEQFPDLKVYRWGWDINPADYDIGIFNMQALIYFANIKPHYLEQLKSLIQEAQIKKGFELYCVYDKPSSQKNEMGIPLNFSWLPIFPEFRIVSPFTKVEAQSDFGTRIKPFYENFNLEVQDYISNNGIKETEPVGSYGNRCSYTDIKMLNSHINSPLQRSVCLDISWRILFFTVGQGISKVVTEFTSPMHFLPFTENINKVIRLILNDLNGTDEPSWLGDIKVRGESELITEIEMYKNNIEKITIQVNEAEQKKEIIQRPKKILYETGKQLEKCVSEVFEELGVKLTKPEDKTIEDRYFEVDNVKIYVEIRGKENSNFLEKDLNQIIQRVADKDSHDKYPLRGIFVFNNQRLTKPNERNNPFNKNITDKAKTFGICLIDTNTLFQIFNLENGSKYFKEKLLNTVGVLSISDIQS